MRLTEPYQESIHNNAHVLCMNNMLIALSHITHIDVMFNLFLFLFMISVQGDNANCYFLRHLYFKNDWKLRMTPSRP